MDEFVLLSVSSFELSTCRCRMLNCGGTLPADNGGSWWWRLAQEGAIDAWSGLMRLWGSSCLQRPNWATMLARSSSRQHGTLLTKGIDMQYNSVICTLRTIFFVPGYICSSLLLQFKSWRWNHTTKIQRNPISSICWPNLRPIRLPSPCRSRWSLPGWPPFFTGITLFHG